MAHGKIYGPLRERRRGTQAAHARKRAASGSVVAASELEHGKQRLASSKVRGRRWRAWHWWRYRLICIGFACYSGVEASGGVRARAWQAAAGMQQAASRLVAASELEHGKLRLASSKVRAASRLVAASELEHGKLRLSRSNRCPARVTEDGGGVRAADRMLQLPSSKVRGVCGSVAEAGVGVRAANGNLPLPSRQFKTPEVGRSWRY
ncbi:hypothetical protein PR002_g21226 [Phytophthora rubi]|uniref:Uncharacterized protein n=1 Tax=Phytophthora rubi TaxID=129364 RepID=A0A6A3J4F3_9STRA|nr:hypothetical protein PR002_g21226 [Phytophthora rubi]